MHPAWRLTVRRAGQPPQSYRFRRPEAAEEIVRGLRLTCAPPAPHEVDALREEGRILKRPGWTLEYAPASQDELLTLPPSGL
ncbi:hypothetical protein LAJ19_13395 [Deinococcus taeanensis]|uniref:hypothetical protein n=1 Tax=Deinococcus taeanensis TaxID=2737050 RepID=UPI001CDBA0A3|nr:hypothetical protein [Deinococcus taeanensis]UBV42601.1 hypothetical protein LAJ19_13395 [Deinococcus taeanensis]